MVLFFSYCNTMPILYGKPYMGITGEGANVKKPARISEAVATIKTSYKDSLDFELDPWMVWRIFDAQGKLFMKGKGSINNIAFSKVGSYTLDLKQPTAFGTKQTKAVSELSHDSCNHAAYPDAIIIEVLPVDLKFDFNTIKFSRPIAGGSIDGVLLSIDVNFDHAHGTSILPEKLSLEFVGIDAQASGAIQEPLKPLVAGKKQNITYELKGTLKSNTYVQINFTNLHEQIIAHALTTKLN